MRRNTGPSRYTTTGVAIAIPTIAFSAIPTFISERAPRNTFPLERLLLLLRRRWRQLLIHRRSLFSELVAHLIFSAILAVPDSQDPNT